MILNKKNNPLDLAASEKIVKEKEENLNNLKNGTDPLDIRAQELAVQQRNNSLSDAREKLADYIFKAPFDGIIIQINFVIGNEYAGNSVFTAIATKQKIAEISLNEVDAAKIKIGQKATLTFDAIDNLSISGEVTQIDTLGTVSQGVVTYNVKILFDTQDDRIKPSMSV